MKNINYFKTKSFLILLSIIIFLVVICYYFIFVHSFSDGTQSSTPISQSISTNDIINNDTKTSTSLLERENKPEYLKLEYEEGFLYYTRTLENGHYKLSYEPNSGNPHLYTNDKHSLYIFVSPRSSLYSINPITLQIKLLSKYEAFLEQEISDNETNSKLARANLSIHAYSPFLHSNSNFIAYMSDRRDWGTFDIWLYNLNENTEHILLERAYFINWYEDELIYNDIDNDKIVSYNIITKRTFDLFEDVEFDGALSTEWIVYTHYYDSNYYFFNINTRQLVQLNVEKPMRIAFPYQISTNKQYVFGNGFENSYDASTHFYFVFDLLHAELTIFTNVNVYNQCEATINELTVVYEKNIHNICEIK